MPSAREVVKETHNFDEGTVLKLTLAACPSFDVTLVASLWED
jgi:hypothetical protein